MVCETHHVVSSTSVGACGEKQAYGDACTVKTVVYSCSVIIKMNAAVGDKYTYVRWPRSATSDIRHLSSVICHPSSVIRHLSSVIRHPSSVIRHLSSVIRHPSSVIRHLSSVICHPSSVIHHLVFSRCGHGCGLFACIRSCILELSNCISTSRETKWLAGLSLSKRAREVEANRKLAQGNLKRL